MSRSMLFNVIVTSHTGLGRFKLGIIRDCSPVARAMFQVLSDCHGEHSVEHLHHCKNSTRQH